MRIEIEYKVTFDPEVEGTEPIPVYDEMTVSQSDDVDTVMGMIDIGIEKTNLIARKQLTVVVSDYIKSLEDDGTE